MSEQPQSLFIDTGAFFAWVNIRAGRHETAQSVFDALRREAIPYQPLFTSTQPVGSPPASTVPPAVMSATEGPYFVAPSGIGCPLFLRAN
jgi:hypothetical protein